jgi:transposase
VEDGTIFVAIEVSLWSWVVGLRDPVRGKVGLHRLVGGDVAGLLALIARKRRKAEAAFGGPVSVVSCYEAGYEGFWLHRVLGAEGVESLVIDPASVAVNRRARRAKTDRLDARLLLRALRAWWLGDAEALSAVRVPGVADEDARRTCRERERLVKERTGHVNRIKGLLATQGVRDYAPLKRDRRRRLAALRCATGAPLPAHLARELERELERLELVMAQIAAVEGERDALVAAAPAGTAEAKIQQLAGLRALGPEISTRLVRELYWRDFDNRRQLASAAGLAPSPFNSGAMAREQGISKAGNRRVRATLVELAWLWLRWQPDSALSRWFRERVGEQKGRVRRIAIVALARKLLVALWRYLETGLVPEGALFKPAVLRPAAR